MVARLLTVAALGLALAAPASAAPGIHAHRGGSLVLGVPTYGENTMPAFRNAAREGYVLELDVKLTQDGVPVVFHDATLDRVTPCSGEIAAKTRAELGACPVDKPAGRSPIPTLAEVLAFAKAEGAQLNLEIKNQPTDSDFDGTSAFASRVMETIIGSGFPRSRLIVQSFWPPNLSVARTRLPGVQTSYLSLSQTNAGAPAFAASQGYEWVSPAWPVTAGFVSQSRALGLRVVPYTLNRRSEVLAAAEAGVDAVISDDPAMAATALGLRRPQLVPDRRDPVVRLSTPAYSTARGRRTRFRVRWRGSDRGSGVAGYTLEVRRNSFVPGRWRPVLTATTRTSVRFRGRRGVSYLFRLRAIDRYGNIGKYDYGLTTVPRDDRTPRLIASPSWRKRGSRGAFMGTLLRTRRAGATATISFRGSRVGVVARRGPRGGRLLVLLDGRRRVVSLRGRARQRRVVFRSRRLGPRRHRLTLVSLGGVIDLDAIAITAGPAPPRP